MSPKKDLPAPLPQLPDLDATYVFEASLTDLEFAFVQLLQGAHAHPGLTQTEFELLAAPLLADLRRAIPPPPHRRELPPLPPLRPLDTVLAPAPSRNFPLCPAATAARLKERPSPTPPPSAPPDQPPHLSRSSGPRC